MKRFAELFNAIDRTNRTSEKVAALADYFRQAPPRDAAWALHVLYGRKLVRAIPGKRLRDWLAEATRLPPWLIDESYDAVGDLSELIALLQPDRDRPANAEPLHVTIEQRLLPLARMGEAEQKAVILQAWRDFNPTQVFLMHKLISQSFRVGLARKQVVNAMAAAAEVDPAVMAHRLLGDWRPTAEDFQRLRRGEDSGHEPGRPYPFCLAHPLEQPPEALGDCRDYLAEWKWDGIRAQIIHRGGQVMIWSRGEELITAGFPELQAAADSLPAAVLDGEVLAWEDGRPLPFPVLQRRINRRAVAPMLFADVPVIFIAYDLLEHEGVDLRQRPLRERRERLARLIADAGEPLLQLSEPIALRHWPDLQEPMRASRDRGVEGLMLKRLDSPYRVGRVKGDWWKWKVDPYTIDAVLIYAQRGSGKRASLFTDYTFGVRATPAPAPAPGTAHGATPGTAPAPATESPSLDDGQGLVPIAKAYSGLDDAEIRQVDAWIRKHTIGRSGPVRFVEPRLVFELAFEGVQQSTRHKAGLALRFPRMARWRRDKTPADADALDAVRALYDQQQRRNGSPADP